MTRACWLTILAAHGLFLMLLFLSGAADVTHDADQYWRLGALCATGDFVWRDSV